MVQITDRHMAEAAVATQDLEAALERLRLIAEQLNAGEASA